MDKVRKMLLDFLNLLKENQELISKADASHYGSSNALDLGDLRIKLNDGICDNATNYLYQLNLNIKGGLFDEVLENLHKLISSLSNKWEHFSGYSMFPIKADESDFVEYLPEWEKKVNFEPKDVNGYEMYLFIGYNNLSQWKGVYGARRWELVDYLIGELTNG